MRPKFRLHKTGFNKEFQNVNFWECDSVQTKENFFQGEMFKAEDLAALAEKMLDVEAKTICGTIDENYQSIICHLMEGHPWLVPHDADHDHRPVIRVQKILLIA